MTGVARAGPRRPAPGRPAAQAPREGFRRRYFRHRVLVLLLVLLAVVLWRAWVRIEEERPVDWNRPHHVVVCPLLGAGTGALALGPEPGRALDAWMAEQFRRRSGREGQPFDFDLAAPVAVTEPPPPLPDAGAGFLARWRGVSRFLSYFRAHDDRFPLPRARGTRVYLYVYPLGEAARFAGRHSVGTRRGRVGVVFAAEDQAAAGNTLAVIAHEALHTVGALDHRREDGSIAWPEGYAEPDREPLHPQLSAEVMALGIPTAPDEELLVGSLEEVVLGEATAVEIGWVGSSGS